MSEIRNENESPPIPGLWLLDGLAAKHPDFEGLGDGG
jgi:hypothetical protein